ncbi:hypothetical protein LZ32DRAFT_456360 [Colletotrichum eremochloae]|nr:hypothetical protein LZ32DRAFT_456360 [Colletotrichum eremochloae]
MSTFGGWRICFGLLENCRGQICQMAARHSFFTQHVCLGGAGTPGTCRAWVPFPETGQQAFAWFYGKFSFFPIVSLNGLCFCKFDNVVSNWNLLFVQTFSFLSLIVATLSM